MATKLAIAIVVGSLLYALAPQGLKVLLPLIPQAVVERFWVWQLASYVFLAGDPLGVIFGALITWSIGGAMESSWGPRRLLLFALGSTVLAGLLTVLVSFVWPTVQGIPFFGATVLTTALWVGYGWSYGRMQTNFWGMPVTGNQLALIGVGFVVLNGAFAGFATQVPSIIVLLTTFAYVRGFSPRLMWLRFHNWRLQRVMKGRAKHLKLISRERNTREDSDRFLH